MNTLLIIYLIIINLVGFLSMWIDKRKAIKNKWRIPEKTLFLIAILFGSIGSLAGMYIFRHKTLHKRFTIGIPLILAIQIAIVGYLAFTHIRHAASASQAVENELSLIKELDPDTIQSFISYKNLMTSDFTSGTVDTEAADAVKLFFQNFSYHITDEQTNENEAVVHAEITNIDMRALSQDLCRAILQQSVSIPADSYTSTISDYYQLLYDTLQNHTYKTLTTTAEFHLTKKENGWTINTDEELENALVSDFIACINDPNILPAAEVLQLHLDAFRSLNAQQWIDYLAISDVFQTCNTEYSSLIDQKYAQQIADSYDYQIIKCTEKPETADIVVRVTSIDMAGVLADYHDMLLEYASSGRSIRDDSVAFSNETAGLLLQALQKPRPAASTDVTIHMRNSGNVWEVPLGSEFTNAVMGGIEGAMETFLNAARQEDTLLFDARY